jgi:hypothetical protein
LIAAWSLKLLKRWRFPPRLGLPLLTALLAGMVVFALLPIEAAPIRVWLGVNGLALGLVITEVSSAKYVAKRRWLAAGIGFVLLLAAVGLFTAYAVPGPESSGDEVMWADTARNWLVAGGLYFRINFAPSVPIAPGVGYWLLVLAEWINLLGLSFGSVRLFVWLAWVVVIAAVGLASVRLYGRWVGVAAASVTASSTLLLSERLLRPEFILPAAGSLILICYLQRSRGWLWSFVCGWLAVLSLEIHAAGIAYIAATTALYVQDAFILWRGGGKPFTPGLMAFAAGGVVGGIAYAITHILILPDPGYFAETLRAGRGFLSFHDFLPQLALVPARYWSVAPVEAMALLLAVIGLVRRGTTADRLVLRAMVFTAAAYAVLVPIPQNYFVLLLPYVAIGIGALVVLGFAAPAPQSEVHIWGTAVALVALATPFLTLSLPAIRLRDPYPAAVVSTTDRCVRAFSDGSARLAVMFESYWALTDYSDVHAVNARPSYSNYAPLDTEFSPWDVYPPDVIAYYPRAYAPTLPPELAGFAALNRYAQIAQVRADDQLLTIWWRPGFEPEGWRARTRELCPLANIGR